MYSNEDKILEVEVPDPAILMRIDTPQDYLSHFRIAPADNRAMIELKEALQIVLDVGPAARRPSASN